MFDTRIRGEIAANPAWAPYQKQVREFQRYFANTEEMNFRVSGLSFFEGDYYTVTREIPYVHRWTALYKSSVIARFYQLEQWLKENPCDVITMLTLTTYHGYNKFGEPSEISHATIEDGFNLLKHGADGKSGWDTLRKTIRMKGYQYVWVMEPHKTGYPHIHVVIFGKVSEKDQERIKRLWHKYGCGSYEHGAQFSEKKGSDSIKSIRNYLMKYMIKAWRDSTWTTAQLVFNALVWDNHWRLWGASGSISDVMQKGAPTKTGINWQKTELIKNKYDDTVIVWHKDGTDLQPFILDYSESDELI